MRHTSLMRHIPYAVTLVMVVCGSAHVFAAEATVTAHVAVDKTDVAVGEPVHYTVTVQHPTTMTVRLRIRPACARTDTPRET